MSVSRPPLRWSTLTGKALSAATVLQATWLHGDHSMIYARQRHSILDLTFYDANTLSLLLLCQNAAEQEEMGGFPVLAQAPLSALEKDGFMLTTKGVAPLTDTPHLSETDVGPLIDAMNWRRLDNMKAASFAVSGTRKVACVLFASLRRVRLFLMDVEDEDEEEEEEEEEEVTVSRVEEEQEEDSSMMEEENKENAS
ncbi:hypothetical protein CAPTEDRAFT_221305 [Capitella teleta]|uniref:Anaphase-promoting complex subunit 4 C-terminal half WD40 domain-containing protein n=1 Tax=Capitella teleta TaxID=283909 RepID=R7UFM0_CAPTE|nr:hypothetical protein CAPTEDRAFT_221305 [Capitella teleta]|eukprot:ELU05334.1 hypothetical protein CAPTEDRAFT_221305 [Capitella teleta]